MIRESSLQFEHINFLKMPLSLKGQNIDNVGLD